MTDFSTKVIIVTGGARGIGRGIVHCLHDQGGTMVVADCDREAGAELWQTLGAAGRFLFIPTDVGCEEDVRHCIAEATGYFGGIDGLVNNAGIAHPGRTPVTELRLETWEEMLRTNLTGAFLMAKHAARHLAARRGAIVNIASTRALQSEPNTEAYSASKGGLVALTHALAASLAHQVRVNVILPGWIDVSRHQKSGTGQPLHLSDEDHLQHPAGRVGVPADVAAMAAFLLSDAATFITGQSFVVDGGMTKKMIYHE